MLLKVKTCPHLFAELSLQRRVVSLARIGRGKVSLATARLPSLSACSAEGAGQNGLIQVGKAGVRGTQRGWGQSLAPCILQQGEKDTRIPNLPARGKGQQCRLWLQEEGEERRAVGTGKKWGQGPASGKHSCPLTRVVWDIYNICLRAG